MGPLAGLVGVISCLDIACWGFPKGGYPRPHFFSKKAGSEWRQGGSEGSGANLPPRERPPQRVVGRGRETPSDATEC